jgi:tRNA pseudouridine55 synthase
MIIRKIVGETMNQLIERIQLIDKYDKIAYTSRLDPMAKGNILFLINEECKDIKKMLNKDKIYEVKIILGIQTDTDDTLGIITKMIPKFDKDEIYKKIQNYIKNIKPYFFDQEYHYYSTKMLNHRKKNNNNKYYHPVKINSVNIIDYSILKYFEWKNKLISNIESIDNKKEFRQKEIIKQWELIDITELSYIKIRLCVTSGFFVRQFIHDMSEYLNFPLLCYNINKIV